MSRSRLILGFGAALLWGPVPLWGPILLWSSAAAFAHAFLATASPAVGSEIKRAPSEVRLTYTEALEPAFSTVQVLDDKGKPVDKGDVSVDGADPHILKVSLPTLPPGTYRVVWRVVSVDTHPTNGSFKFAIEP